MSQYEPPKLYKSEGKIEAQAQIELSNGKIAYLAESVEEIEKMLQAQPPARWVNVTLLYEDAAGAPRKTWRRIRGEHIIAIGPATSEYNTG